VAGPEGVGGADRARHGDRCVLRHAAGGGADDQRVLELRDGEEDGEAPGAFGSGEIQGVAGPESANNAAAQCAFIPTLTLGIPGSGTMALMLGALTIQGIAPGPQVMTQRPELFWGLIASMWIGNAMLVILNLPLIGCG
jgi:TctA family transporter